MHPLNRLFALSGFTAMLGALAFAAPAAANLKAQCVVDGEIKADTTKPVFKKYVQLIGGSGTFAFAGPATTCIDLGTGKAPGTVHVGLITATGTFKQDVLAVPTPCGWAKALGVITAQFFGPKFAVIVGKKFAIEFGPPYGALGTGAFFWHHPGPFSKSTPVPKLLPGPTAPPKVAGPKPYRYAGSLQLGPSSPLAKAPAADLAKLLAAPPLDKCAKSFHVNGSVLVHEHDGPN